jgi:hypothetical protein
MLAILPAQTMHASSTARQILFSATLMAITMVAVAVESLDQTFSQPPDKARPWVYWYFQDGHLTREGMKADLEAMKKAGIGGALYLEVTAMGIPKGPVEFMSPAWQDLIVAAMRDCDRLGLEFSLGAGPGWCGDGGPWISGDNAMQQLVGSSTDIKGGQHVEIVLPQPPPREPFFGKGTLGGGVLKEWQQYYRDEKVIAYPKPRGGYLLRDIEEKVLYKRAPYSNTTVKAYLPEDPMVISKEACIDPRKVIDLTGKMSPDGKLSWDAPAGDWTIMRWGRTLTGQTTRPAPESGLGFESGKLEAASFDQHYEHYLAPLIQKLGGQRQADRGWTTLHFDSWESSSQNWSATFGAEFKKRRGYDPLPWLPAMAGQIVESVPMTERFLWDLRRTAQELVVDNHIGRMKALAAKSGLKLAIEPYDMNPAGDLALGDVADTPSAEFWSNSAGTKYSVFEAVSCAHTAGRKVVQAEAFTSWMDAWRQHPASMKDEGDWALCTGVNRFCFHRYSAQPEANPKPPGLPWGPYGVHWERTQTWWEMAPAYHDYLTRCQALLQTGLPVADILFLDAEGAPNVFRPPVSALLPGEPDRKGYNFDGCSTGRLIKSASVKNGRIVFPDGMSYSILVLPQQEAMTPEVLRKIKALVDDGALIFGRLPSRSPSLEKYPESDREIARISKELIESNRIVLDNRPLPDRVSKIAPQAFWIWSNDGKPQTSSPAGDRYFHYTWKMSEAVESAECAITADDGFDLSVNGKVLGGGDNFNNVITFDITSALRTGENSVDVTAHSAKEGPAGLIATITIKQRNGQVLRFNTDKSWLVGTEPGKISANAIQVGASDTWPWNLTVASKLPNFYPDYSQIAELLSSRGIRPDFESDGDLRYIHRVDGDTDYYFVGNRKAEPQKADVRFRVTGRSPFLWDPLTGTQRPLPEYSERDGVTTIPMEFAPTQSFFVVFKPKDGESLAAAGKNFPVFQPLVSLDKDWIVAFDPKWGGPEKPIAFNSLDDWSKREEEGIRYYSGTAVYEKTFDLPNVPTKLTCLDLGRVAVMADVTLNGKNLGVTWCPPWQVTIPAGVLRATGNNLEIKVANLWPNRLIGDAGLPKEKRVAQLTESSNQFYKPDSPLLPSGLLGPVRILSEP